MISEWRLKKRRGREFVVEGRKMIPPVCPSEVSRLVQWRQPGRLAVAGQEGRGSGVTESPVLRQRRHRAEGLAALVALDLHAAVGVHPLVPAQVRELGVRLEADLATERLDRAVDVCVLLEAAGGGEGFAALWTGVAARAHVRGADVSLQVAGVREDLVAVLAGEPPELAVHHLVAQQVGAPGEPLAAVLAHVLVRLVPVVVDHVLVQAASET